MTTGQQERGAPLARGWGALALAEAAAGQEAPLGEGARGLAHKHRDNLLSLMGCAENVLVRASAGTGKTYSLVARLLHLLAGMDAVGEAVPPGALCAITFTEKAAAEMEDRLRKEVQALARDPSAHELLTASAARLGRPLPDGAHWRRVYRDLGGMVLSTFHGFCARVLREYPIEAGVEPGFKVADELQAEQLLLQAAEGVVFGGLGSSEEGCLRLLHVLSLHDPGAGAGGLVKLCADVLGRLREDGREARHLEARARRPEPERTRALRAEALRAMREQRVRLGQFRGKINPRMFSQPKEQGFLEELDEFLEQADALDRQVAALSPEAWLENLPLLVRYAKPLDARALPKLVRSALSTGPLGQEDFLARHLSDAAEHVRADFVALLGQVEEAYARRKRSARVLDFADLLLAARALLRGRVEVRRALKQRFRLLLVDEFQDTNAVQLELVLLLAEGLEAERRVAEGEEVSGAIKVAKDRLFVVGDPKQSIYNFRGADVSVFNQMHKRLKIEQEAGEIFYLRHNRRSLSGLISFGNRWFSEVLGVEGEADPAFVVRFTEDDKLDPWRSAALDEPPVEFLAVADSAGPEVEAEALSRWIVALVREGEALLAQEAQRAQAAAQAEEARGEPSTPEDAPPWEDGEEGLGWEPVWEQAEEPEPVGWGASSWGAPEVGPAVPAMPEPAPPPVEEGRRAWRYGDIAILLRNFTHLQFFQEALQRAGVPHYVVKGRGFYGCAEVLDLAMALQVLLDPEDALAMVGVLRAPLFLVSDEGLGWLQRLAFGEGGGALHLDALRRVARRLRRGELDPQGLPADDLAAVERCVELYERLAPEADRLGAAGTLEALVEATRLREKLAGTFRGRQKIGNIEKLIELGRAYSRETWSNLPGFVRRLQVLIEREPRESEGQVVEERSDAVRIMTIHQSKGLEFPVVAVPEVHTIAARAASGAPILYDRQFGVQARLRVRMRGNPKPLELCTEAYDNLRKIAKEREEAEERRLIYVAVTRAKDRLWLSGRGYAREHHGGRTQLSKPNPLSKLQDLIHEQDRALSALCRERFLDELPPLTEREADADEEAGGLDGEAWRSALGRVAALAQPQEDEGGFVEVSASVSQLADFMRCPRRYWLWHELGLEEGGGGEELEREAGEEVPAQGWGLSLGVVAHAVLEALELDAYERADAQGRAAILHDALRACGLPLAWEEEVREAVAGALDGELLGWMAGLARAGRLWRERPFWLRLEGEREVLCLRGRLDAVWLDAQGVGILDWKFARRGLLGASAHQWQLAMYALAARTLMEDERPTWRAKVFYLKDARGEEVGGDEEVLEGLRRVLPLMGRRLALARRRGQWPRVDAQGEPRDRARCEEEGCAFVRRCFGG